MKKTLNERIKSKVFHAWTLFKRDHLKAKDYWYRIYLRLDLSMKQSAIKRWKEVTQIKAENELRNIQHQKVDMIEDLNHQIGETHILETL